jgi:photosystem II stability/assembly factor-like uncharacterized protein
MRTTVYHRSRPRMSFKQARYSANVSYPWLDHASEALAGEEAVGSGDGLRRSRDGGENFERVAGGLEGLNIWDIGFSPTGSLFASSEAGVFRSEDRGESWAQVLPLEDGEYVEIGFSPTHPRWVAVSSYAGLWSSTDGGQSWLSH